MPLPFLSSQPNLSFSLFDFKPSLPHSYPHQPSETDTGACPMTKNHNKNQANQVNGVSNPVSNGVGHDVDKKPDRGLMSSDYARSKRDLMNLINQIRSTGACHDVE